MQHNDELKLTLSSTAASQRPLRDRIGIPIQGTDSLNTIITRVKEAEQAGVRQVWISTTGIGVTDILTVLAIVATQTEHIRLGTGIVPTYPRHPLALAQQALTVHDIAPGRLRLGIGPSIQPFIEGVYGLEYTSPLSHLKEYLEVLRALLWEGSVDHHGTFFNVTYTLPRTARVPLLISALGLKAFRLAGEFADGVLPAWCPLPYLLNQALPALRAGAEAHKRPAPPIIASLPVALSTDEAAVLAAVRQSVQMMTQVGPYAQMFTQAGFAGAVAGDESSLNALTRSLVISGDEETVRNRLRVLLASGIDELALGLVPIADEASERMRLFHLIGSLDA